MQNVMTILYLGRSVFPFLISYVTFTVGLHPFFSAAAAAGSGSNIHSVNFVCWSVCRNAGERPGVLGLLYP